jgi:hypothetical protein
MYYVIDLRQDPPQRVPDVKFETLKECCEWIDLNGDVSIYTIEEDI